MADTTVFKDIVVSEGELENAKFVAQVKYTYGSFGSQLKNLTDVKGDLCKQASSHGCNAIANFKYGQKASWFSLDDTKWWGEADAVIIPEKDYQKFLKETN